MTQDAGTPSTAAPTTETWTKRLGTDAVFLAVLSGLGYWIAFAYESGYASHFGYPTFLISPSLSAIIVAFGALAGALMGAAPIVMDLFRSGDARARRLAYWVVIGGLFAFFALQAFFISNYSWSALWRVAPGVLLFILVRWTSRLQDKAGGAANFKVSMALLALVMAMVLHFMSSFLGLAAAKDQRVFYFLTAKPEYAAVRIYDGMTIAVRFNGQTNSFTGEYLLLKLGEEPKELGLKRVALMVPRLPVLKSGEP